jgi:hypothetical protein
MAGRHGTKRKHSRCRTGTQRGPYPFPLTNGRLLDMPTSPPQGTAAVTGGRSNAQCDENKPACNRCRIGARDCHYPASLSARDDSVVEAAESSSTSSPDFPLLPELPPNDQAQTQAITSISLPSHELLPWRPNKSLAIKDAMPDPYMFPYSATFPPPLHPTPASSIASSTYFVSSRQSSEFPTLPGIFNIPRSPAASASRHQAIQFFLKYHQEQVMAAQYFRYYDYSHFYTRTLLTLGESSGVLGMAIAAFSALVFSFKVHRGARPVAFFYYSKALQGLGLMLGEAEKETNGVSIALVTALELASFDVQSAKAHLLIFSATSGMLRNAIDTSAVRRASSNRLRRLNDLPRTLSGQICSSGFTK